VDLGKFVSLFSEPHKPFLYLDGWQPGTHASLFGHKEPNHMGVSLMEQDLLHESVAEKVWIAFYSRKLVKEPYRLF
jgi:hypothetical protein